MNATSLRKFFSRPAVMTGIALIMLSLITGCAAMKKGTEIQNAQSVIDAYIEATGGKTALTAIKTRKIEGTFEMPGAGIEGDITILNAYPDGYLMAIEFDGFPGFSRGTDGTTVWEIHPMNGARIIEGDELAATKTDMQITPLLHWQKTYKKAKLTGQAKINDRDCHRIELGGGKNPQIFFFDKKSSELTKMEMISETQQGPIDVEVFYDDYRSVDNIRIPFTQTLLIMGQEQILTFDKVLNNPDIPTSTFAVPDEIQTLLDN